MDLNVTLQLIFIGLSLVIMSIFHFIKEKKLSYDYIKIVIFSILSGYSVYIGLLWILKPLGVVIDNTIFDSALYNVLVGAILITFTIISLKEELVDKEKKKNKESG